MRTILWIEVVLAVVLGMNLATGLEAADRTQNRASQAGPTEMRERIKGFMQDLELTPEQRRELARLLRGRGEEARETVEELREKRDRLADAVTDEDPDPQAIRRAARSLARALTDRAIRLHENVPALQEILTDEQRQQIADRRSQREEKVNALLAKIERIVDAIKAHPRLAEKLRERAVDAEQFPLAARLRERRQRRIEKLGITDQQREEIREIMISHAGEILSHVRDLVDAHRDLRDEVLDSGASNRDVHRAGADLGRALADACVRLADLLSQVRPVLTEDQVEEAREMREERLERRREMVDRWLEKLGSGMLGR
jgi:Spy/CpxP family protein refolding chaperone